MIFVPTTTSPGSQGPGTPVETVTWTHAETRRFAQTQSRVVTQTHVETQTHIASKCPKNLLNLAGPIGASQQVSEVSQQLKVAVTRTKDELAQLQNDVTHLRTRAAAPFQTNNQTRCK